MMILVHFNCLFGTILLLTATFNSVYSADTNPGFKVTITNKGLQFVSQMVQSTITEGIKHYNTETDFDESYYLTFSGKLLGYDWKRIDIPKPTFHMISNGPGLKIELSHIIIDMSTDLNLYDPFSTSDKIDVFMKATLSISVQLGESGGHPTMKASDCSIKIHHQSITAQNSWRIWSLLNFFSLEQVTPMLCNAIVNFIDTDSNNMLKSMPVIKQIDDIAELDYSLVSAPLYVHGHIITSHKGEFHARGHRQNTQSALSPPILPATETRRDKMVYIWLTQHIANTAGIVYQQAGILTYQWHDIQDLIPKGFISQMIANYSIKQFFPELYNAYPDMNVTLTLKVIKPPSAVIISSNMRIIIPGQIEFFVLDYGDNSSKSVFTLEATVYADIKIRRSYNMIQEITDAVLKVDLSLDQTNIGQCNVAILEEGINRIATYFIIPMIKDYGQEFISNLSAMGFSVINTTFEFGEGYILIGTDFDYQPEFISFLY